jgi:hypothetical protein
MTQRKYTQGAELAVSSFKWLEMGLLGMKPIIWCCGFPELRVSSSAVHIIKSAVMYQLLMSCCELQ